MAQHAFWIIVDGQTPTSFRSRQREDLVPTLHQLQRKQPQVVLMWFERGRLWKSPTEAREALAVRRRSPAGRPRGWRPGGDHVDPRAKYAIPRDQKRARFKARLDRDRREGSQVPDGPPPTDYRDRGSRPARPDRFVRPPFRPKGPSGRSFPREGRPAGHVKPREARGQASNGANDDRRRSPKPKAFGDRPWKPRARWRPKGPWRPPKRRKG